MTKNAKAHKMPLVGTLKTLVGKHGADDDVVFGYTLSGYRTAKDKFLETTKLAHFTTHDTRRTFSEYLSLCGYNELVIAVTNNHSMTTVTGKHYLGGSLAKSSLQVRMLTDLQNQFSFYFYGNSESSNPQQAPDEWESTQFTQSVLGWTVFQAHKLCKIGTVSIHQTPKLKTLFSLRLTKILISQL